MLRACQPHPVQLHCSTSILSKFRGPIVALSRLSLFLQSQHVLISSCLHRVRCCLVRYGADHVLQCTLKTEDHRSHMVWHTASHSRSTHIRLANPFVRRMRLAAVCGHRLVLATDLKARSLDRMICTHSAGCQLLLNMTCPWL